MQQSILLRRMFLKGEKNMATGSASGISYAKSPYGGIGLMSIDDESAVDSATEGEEGGKETTEWSVHWDENGFTGNGWFADPLTGLNINENNVSILHTEMGQLFYGPMVAKHFATLHPECAYYYASTTTY